MSGMKDNSSLHERDPDNCEERTSAFFQRIGALEQKYKFTAIFFW